MSERNGWKCGKYDDKEKSRENPSENSHGHHFHLLDDYSKSMLLKEATNNNNREGENLTSRRGGSRKPPSSTAKIALVIMVLVIVGAFTYFFYLQSQSNSVTGNIIDWRMRLTFNDARTGTNYTLPQLIGTSNGAWSNHTLDPFGPQGYSPLSTRDTSSVIWIQSTEPAVFNFGDFFNVWGQVFNETCVSDTAATVIGTYCSAASEPVIYDTKSTGVYDPSGDYNVSVVSDLPIALPNAGAPLSSDPHILFVSVKGSTVWNVNETIVYDADNNGVYDLGVDRMVYNGVGAQAPTAGTALIQDSRLKFYDWNGNNRWDGSVPPPVLSDGTNVRCLSRGINLSNGKDWLIILWSRLYSTISGGCIPTGS